MRLHILATALIPLFFVSCSEGVKETSHAANQQNETSKPAVQESSHAANQQNETPPAVQETAAQKTMPAAAQVEDPQSVLVKQVKESVLGVDRSVTVGDAFDNYAYFKKTGWSVRQDAQKRRIVQFRASFDKEKIKADTDYDFICEFKIAVDGQSFELAFDGVEFNKGGRNHLQADQQASLVASIYQNQPVNLSYWVGLSQLNALENLARSSR